MDDYGLRKVGLKATGPRLRILELLAKAEPRHMNADDIHLALARAGDDIGLATVYRVLAQFEAAGLVNRHRFEEGGAVFELERGEHHDHIVCTRCGKVEEFIDPTIEARQNAVAEKMGYEIEAHSLVIYGSCTDPDCPERPERPEHD